jgi:hypothetical protein
MTHLLAAEWLEVHKCRLPRIIIPQIGESLLVLGMYMALLLAVTLALVRTRDVTS